VAFIYAGFGLAIFLARRTPLQGFARRLQTSQDLFEQKRFIINTLLKQANYLAWRHRLDPQFLKIGCQMTTEPEVGQRDAKNFWSSLSKQTRKKSKNLK